MAVSRERKKLVDQDFCEFVNKRLIVIICTVIKGTVFDNIKYH